jgi:hypothetical protein
VIYVGIDDTDIVGSPGTNQLARAIVKALGPAGTQSIICRHQLFFDPRVPYTSQNGSASLQLPRGHAMPHALLIDTVRSAMRAWYVEGSDTGLAVTTDPSAEMAVFAARAKTEVVTQAEARTIAAQSGCHLEGLGGTNQGIIGALAAIALVAGGEDGRIVHVEGWPWPDALSGPQPVPAILARGVAEIRTLSGEPFTGDIVDVGKHLRPNWRGGRLQHDRVVTCLLQSETHRGARLSTDERLSRGSTLKDCHFHGSFTSTNSIPSCSANE